MSAGHSATAGTEHRGRVITSLHGLPVYRTEMQEAMDLPPSDPDEFDYREVIEGTMQSTPGSAHVIYAEGKRVEVIEPAGAWNVGDVHKLAQAYRMVGYADVIVDTFCPMQAVTSAYDTMPDDRLTPSIGAEQAAFWGDRDDEDDTDTERARADRVHAMLYGS